MLYNSFIVNEECRLETGGTVLLMPALQNLCGFTIFISRECSSNLQMMIDDLAWRPRPIRKSKKIIDRRPPRIYIEKMFHRVIDF